MRILLVEDEQKVAEFIRKGLEEASYTVDIAADAEQGFDLVANTTYDLIISDIMLPGIDGIEFCKRLRNSGITLPVLMLTALDAVSKKVEGLESGADDYLTKPFAFSELLARVKALLRRPADLVQELVLDDLKVDILSRRVFRGEREITLTPKEYALLEFLLRNKGRVLSRTQIIEQVWGYNFDPGSNVVDVHIKYLREKIDRDARVKLIHTVRGTGYFMKAEDDR